MKQVIKLDVQNQLNAGVLNYLQRAWNTRPEPHNCAPEDFSDPYKQLETHPELVGWLWDNMSAKLPKACQWIVYGKPVLIHPKTGVIFGFGHGDLVIGLRLELDKIGEAIMAGMEDEVEFDDGTSLYSDDIGHDWVFCTWTEDDPDWCLCAYEAAGKGV